MILSNDIEAFRQIPLQNRKVRSKYYIDKLPNRVPVLINLLAENTTLDKFKYILPKNYTLRQVREVLFKNAEVSKEKAVCITVGKRLLKQHLTLEQIFEESKDEDGFLYLTISTMPAFG